MEFEKLKDAVRSIEMPKAMEDRMKKNIRKKMQVQPNRMKWVSAACAFGVLLTMMLVMPNLNKTGDAADFAITAYAMGDEGQEIHTDVTTEKAIVETGTDFREGLIAISGSGPNYIFTDVRLGVTGEQIESITYKLNDGMFIEDVTLSYEKFIDKEWLLAENINFIGRELDSDVYEGIKDVGNSYQVRYEDQDQHNYTLALPHDGNEAVSEGIIITVQVEYKDGNTEQQEIMVTQESNEIVLKLM
ncbi:hypothetical protein [Sporosarcina sp. P33]|uniref:hypothetical protein n=1 Tax=Sporosarcina sp. P33 TaxID=1930764 RepID=UPI0009C25CE9|nr:hypothetical protein [Sporosarcina sp. P33]ARD47492.1 hypothetical protein SporoP33_04070 [Sporosarcina sp. P33]